MRTRAARSTSKSSTTGGEPHSTRTPLLACAQASLPWCVVGWVPRTIGREEAGGVMAASLTEDKQQEAYEITPLEYM